MTAIVGIYCTDGVVLAADSSATFSAGQTCTIEQPFDKLFIINGQIILAGTGAVGLGQRFHAILQKSWQNKDCVGKTAIEIGKVFSQSMIMDMKQTYVNHGQYGALVAFLGEKKHQLCEFDIPTFQPELKNAGLWYCSAGSGQPITDPFLGLMRDIFWSDGPPSVQEGVFAATWAIDHAIAVNPGGVNGPTRVAVLEKSKSDWRARLLSGDELEEHRQCCNDAKEALREFRRNFSNPPTQTAPPQLSNRPNS